MFPIKRLAKFFILGMILLVLLLAACGGDDEKDQEKTTTVELRQAITTFNGALTFRLPADATFDGSQADQARVAQFTLKSGLKGYAAWGPMPPTITPDADGVIYIFQAGGGILSNIEKFEINGNPAAKAEGDYSGIGQGYGYVLGVVTNEQEIMMTFAATDKNAFDLDKETILAIVDSVAVDGNKLPLYSSIGQ